MARKYCSKHSRYLIIGKCKDCGIEICSKCRRYMKGDTFCRECYRKRWYKQNKQFKDKLQYGKYSKNKFKQKTDKTSILGFFIQLLIIGITGIIIFKISVKKGWISEDINFQTVTKIISETNNFNPIQFYKIFVTKIEMQELKREIKFFKIKNMRYPNTYEEFLINRYTPNFHKKLSKDAWKNEYVYILESDKNIFSLISKGPDYELNTKDDIILTNKGEKEVGINIFKNEKLN